MQKTVTKASSDIAKADIIFVTKMHDIQNIMYNKLMHYCTNYLTESHLYFGK